MPRPTSLPNATRRADPHTPEEQAYNRTLLGRLDHKILNTPATKTVCSILLLAALIIPAVQFVIRIQETDSSLWRAGGQRHRTALGRWIPTAELIANGDATEHPYGFGHWFPTPPMILISLVPLAKLGYVGAGVVWAVLKVGGFLFAMVFLIRTLDREGFNVPLGVIIAAGIFSIRPIVSDLQHGNLNIFMMIHVAFALALYIRHKDFWAGIFVALAIVTKVTPALLLVYFLYKRAWRVCLGAGVGLLLVFVLIPSLYLGFNGNVEHLTSWFHMLVAPFALHGYATIEVDNQSLYSVALRLGSHAGILDLHHMSTQEAFNAGMENMARPATFLGRLLKPALAAPIVLMLGWFCRSRFASRRDPRLLLEVGMVLIAMLLLSERTWDHHATTLPIVFLGVWYALTCVDLTDRFRGWFVAGLIVQLACLAGNSAGFLPDEVTYRFLYSGVFCWGLVLCFVQIAVLIRALKAGENRNQASSASP